MSDYNILIQDMAEEKNKWVKAADAKNMASVTEKMQNGTASNEQKFIMFKRNMEIETYS